MTVYMLCTRCGSITKNLDAVVGKRMNHKTVVVQQLKHCTEILPVTHTDETHYALEHSNSGKKISIRFDSILATESIFSIRFDSAITLVH